ncbi:hypothetical protein CN933_29600 [Sinorhizobium sp. M4_45]|nr:hypothetical protein CN933_29600 [Sinorhizobium sp. M4_45]
MPRRRTAWISLDELAALDADGRLRRLLAEQLHAQNLLLKKMLARLMRDSGIACGARFRSSRQGRRTPNIARCTLPLGPGRAYYRSSVSRGWTIWICRFSEIRLPRHSRPPV